MIIDAAGERSEQGRFLSKSPGSSNAVLGRRGHGVGQKRPYFGAELSLGSHLTEHVEDYQQRYFTPSASRAYPPTKNKSPLAWAGVGRKRSPPDWQVRDAMTCKRRESGRNRV